jgi:hypothetical protein
MSINFERLEILRDQVKREREHFDMQYWFTRPALPGEEGDDCDEYDHEIIADSLDEETAPIFEDGQVVDWCGTTACLAGHALLLFEPHLQVQDAHGRTRFEVSADTDVQRRAQKLLGLKEMQAHCLFVGILGTYHTGLPNEYKTPAVRLHQRGDALELSFEERALILLDEVIAQRRWVWPHEVRKLREHFEFLDLRGDEV